MGIGAALLAVLLAASIPPAEAWAQSMPGAGRSSRPAAPSGAESTQRLKTIGLSLLVPGLGHIDAGHRQRAIPYLVLEAGFWTAFGVSRVQGSLRRDSYVEMAGIYAGVDRAEGRDDDFYQRIGSWSSSTSYDQLVRREARTLYPDDLAARAAYVEANRTPDDSAWEWESRAAWLRYRDKRQSSQDAYRRASSMLGLAAANRLVAMLDATLLLNRKGESRALHLQMAPGRDPGVTQLQLSWQLP